MSGLMADAQEQQPVFSAPFDFPLLLSGNFGELRTNHFHGGLDFKTGGQSGKAIMALADGYIAQIKVTNGSGCVLEVKYDNGYYTINRHLSAFMPEIQKRVTDLQYEKKRYQVTITPGVDEYRVRRGEQIGWSGNTGFSFGPHLHLDVIESATGKSVDPMPMFASELKDTMAPKAFGFRLFPQLGKGVVNGQTDDVKLAVGELEVPTVWGEIGVGIRAYDYMDGTTNKYGVKYVTLNVDGETVFKSVVDQYASYENPYINSWVVEDYMKSYLEPGNRLRMLTAYNGNRGLLTIDEEREYQLEYILSDEMGNSSVYRLRIEGKRQEIPEVDTKGRNYWARTRTNVIHEPGMQLVVPKGMLYDDHLMRTKVLVDSSAVAYTYQLHDKPFALHQAKGELSIGLMRKPVADKRKYFVAKVSPSGKLSSVGGRYDDGFMRVNIRQIGTYTVAVDTVAPVVKTVNAEKWSSTGRIVFSMSDKLTGISWFTGTIDGKFAVFGRRNMTQNLYECELDEKHFPKTGKKRKVEMIAADGCGNKTVCRTSFVW